MPNDLENHANPGIISEMKENIILLLLHCIVHIIGLNIINQPSTNKQPLTKLNTFHPAHPLCRSPHVTCYTRGGGHYSKPKEFFFTISKKVEIFP